MWWKRSSKKDRLNRPIPDFDRRDREEEGAAAEFHRLYRPPAQPYGGPQPKPHAQATSHASPHGENPPKEHKPPQSQSPYYGAPAPHGENFLNEHKSSGSSKTFRHVVPVAAPYGSPSASLVRSAFPPGTDYNVVKVFLYADEDGSGFIDSKELQRGLSLHNRSFSIRAVDLLMDHFSNSSARKIGPKEFTQLVESLQNWMKIFKNFDRDGSGRIDLTELRDALMSLGFAVSPMVFDLVVSDLVVSEYDKTGGKPKAIKYENFVECCAIVQGLTQQFKEKFHRVVNVFDLSYNDKRVEN